MIENVFICSNDDKVWTSTAKEEACPDCKVKQKPCGWFETSTPEDVTD